MSYYNSILYDNCMLNEKKQNKYIYQFLILYDDKCIYAPLGANVTKSIFCKNKYIYINNLAKEMIERCENKNIQKQESFIYPRITKTNIGYNEGKRKINLKEFELIKPLSMNLSKARSTLDEIATLKENWNNNGASEFSENLIKKCYNILEQLPMEPFICPTACGSVQFEYEKKNGEYLEFEIYEDKIESYLIMSDGKEQEKNLYKTSEIKQMVVDFYG